MTQPNRPQPEECDCCGFETTALRGFHGMQTTIGGGGSMVREDFWYCELCSTSQTSAFSRYPGKQPGTLDVMKAVCVVGNAILAAMKAQQDSDRKSALMNGGWLP